MDHFVALAIAHFLALLVPGVDFFLVARTAMRSGWRVASGAAFGIAVANGVFIVAAFLGLSLVSNPAVLAAIQLAGGVFLVSIGVAFLRSDARLSDGDDEPVVRASWVRSFGLGFASGILNPKNALFYLSLAAALGGAAPLALVGYGAWMFGVVLAWDLLVAVVLGTPRALARLERGVPWLTRIAGGVLVVFGLGMLGGVAVQLVR